MSYWDSSSTGEAQTCIHVADFIRNESVIWLMADKLTRKASSNRVESKLEDRNITGDDNQISIHIRDFIINLSIYNALYNCSSTGGQFT